MGDLVKTLDSYFDLSEEEKIKFLKITGFEALFYFYPPNSRLEGTIVKTPGVMGGEACIVRTRIPVWLLIESMHEHLSDKDILVAYPSLRADDLVNAREYYYLHKAEIDAVIKENQAA